MAQMTTTNGANTLQVYVVRKTLEYAKPKLVYTQFGAPDLSLLRKGKTASWLRFSKLSIPGSALSESPSWAPETVTDTTVTATLELWGNGVELTELLEKTSFLELPDEFKELIGQNAGETINEKVRDVLFAGTNVEYANGRANRDALIAGDVADLNDILNTVEDLEAADAPRIGGEYVAIGSPYYKTSLMKDTAFREATRYLVKENSLFTGELVNIDGVRHVITSTAASVTNAGSIVVDRTIILGKNAFGIARLLPEDFKIVHTPPGGHGDEYAVKDSWAWKAYLKAVILNQAFMKRLESART